MIDLDYAARQTAGVWKLVWNRPGWQTEIDRSVDDVFRSFQAMLLVFPVVLIGRFSVRRAAERIEQWSGVVMTEAPYIYAVSAQTLVFYIDWAFSIAALLIIARATGASRRAGDIVIAYNWAQIPISFARTLPLALFSVRSVQIAGEALYLPALIFIILVLWGVLRRAMGAKRGAAAATIFLLTAIGLTVDALVTGLASFAYRSFG